MTFDNLKKFFCRLFKCLSFVLNPCVERFVINSNKCSIVFKNHWDAIRRNYYIVRPRSGLLVSCSPSAIARLVIPVRVYSVNSVARRAFPHVNNKCSGVIKPPFAHLYSPCSVLRVLLIVLVVAAAFCVVVRLKFSTLFPSNTVAVSNRPSGSGLFFKAPATVYSAAPNCIQVNGFLNTTGALKNPFCVA